MSAEEYSSTPELSMAERASIVSEPASEEHQTDNDHIASAEEDSVDHPTPSDNPIQEKADAPVAEFTVLDGTGFASEGGNRKNATPVPRKGPFLRSWMAITDT